jgi:hypothetical protein
MVYVLHNGPKSFLKEFYLFHAHVFCLDVFETSRYSRFCDNLNLFWKDAGYFLAAYHLRQLGKKIQMFATSCRIIHSH